MKYFLDTEFNGFGGELISLALVREDGESFYAIVEDAIAHWRGAITHPWVKENVIPVLTDCPVAPIRTSARDLGYLLAAFLLNDDGERIIIADWPEDIALFNRALITGPGAMVNIDSLTFKLVRVESYPTTLEGAVQHNAFWDARALKHAWCR